MSNTKTVKKRIQNPTPDDLAMEWFTRNRNEALSANRSAEQQLTAEERPIAADLLERVMAAFSEKGDVPLPCILFTAAKIYGATLQLCIENMERQQGPTVLIH